VDLELAPEQHELVAATRDYADRIVRPATSRLEALESAGEFPWDLMREGTALGLKGLPLPRELGGRDADMVTQCLVVEELAAADLSVAYFFRHYWRFARMSPRLPAPIRDLVVHGIAHDERFVPASASTEPESGSDNALPYDAAGHGAMLSARLEGERWVLNGRKFMITNGGIASLYFVLARTDPAVGLRSGATMIAVPADTPGLSTGPLYRKLGQRGSPQADVLLDECRVPRDYAISEVGHGYEASDRGLTAANITNAGMCLGVARAAYDAALAWSLDRLQGGVPIYRHQLVAQDLGRMRMMIATARSHLHAVAWAYSHSPGFRQQQSWEVRVFAAEVAIDVTQKAMFLFGGRGIMADHPIEKLVRDALTLTHGNGTNALMTMKLGTAQAEDLAASRGAAAGAGGSGTAPRGETPAPAGEQVGSP
jgi:alkylation response protein AidB-like acyl-CoA dehydrogenase